MFRVNLAKRKLETTMNSWISYRDQLKNQHHPAIKHFNSEVQPIIDDLQSRLDQMKPDLRKEMGVIKNLCVMLNNPCSLMGRIRPAINIFVLRKRLGKEMTNFKKLKKDIIKLKKSKPKAPKKPSISIKQARENLIKANNKLNNS